MPIEPAVTSVLFWNVLRTVLNRMMLTASLVTPSPKTTLNSLGCSDGLIKEIAAITSDEHKREHIRRISMVSSFSGELTLTNG